MAWYRPVLLVNSAVWSRTPATQASERKTRLDSGVEPHGAADYRYWDETAGAQTQGKRTDRAEPALPALTSLSGGIATQVRNGLVERARTQRFLETAQIVLPALRKMERDTRQPIIVRMTR